jgi:hypothetical protein
VKEKHGRVNIVQIYIHVNGKIIPVESITGMVGGGDKGE